mgnify:CR=1 FL=1
MMTARWWKGYVLVRLRGGEPERFLNLCRSRGIELWDLQITEEGCQGLMTVPGILASRELQKKSGIRLRVLKRFGLPFFLRKTERERLFAGLAVCLSLLYSLSFFSFWDIQIEGKSKIQ